MVSYDRVRRAALPALPPPGFAPPAPILLRVQEREGNLGVQRALAAGDTGAVAREVAGIAEPDRGVAMPAPGSEHLPDAVLERMNALFDHDFSHVRIRRDKAAAEAAAGLDAHAFALGADLFFGAGEFAPTTPEGERLLVHELTHVVQADEGRLGAPGVSSPDDRTEQEAYANEARLGGKPAPDAAATDVARSDDPAGREEEALQLVDLALEIPGLPPFAPAADLAAHQHRVDDADTRAYGAVAAAEAGGPAFDAAVEDAHTAIDLGHVSARIWAAPGWIAVVAAFSTVGQLAIAADLAARRDALEAEISASRDALWAARQDVVEVAVKLAADQALDALAKSLIAASPLGGPLGILVAVGVTAVAGFAGDGLDDLLGPETVVGKTEHLGAVKTAFTDLGALAGEGAPRVGAAVAELGPLAATLGTTAAKLGGALSALEAALEMAQAHANLLAAHARCVRAQRDLAAFERNWRETASPAILLAQQALANTAQAIPVLLAGLEADLATIADLEARLA